METPQAPTVEENIAPPSPDFKAPPGMDSELDDALNKAFRNSVPQNQPKESNETQKPVEKEISKEQPKEPVKEPISKPEGDRKGVEEILPEPETIKTDVPKNQVAWNALKGNYKRAHGEIVKRDEEIKKLKMDLSERGTKTTKEVEDLKKQVDELSKYRAMLDIQADPEFISKYDKPLNDKIADMMQLLGVSEEAVRGIDYNNTTVISRIAQNLKDQKDEVIADEFRSLAREIKPLANSRIKAYKEQSENFKQTLETRKKEAATKGVEHEGKVISHLNKIVSEKKEDGSPRYPFLNKLSLKEGAAEGEIQQVEMHNKLVEAINSKIEGALKDNTPEGKAELAIAAGAAHYLSRQLSAAYSIIKSLKDEVNKISSVSTEKEKSTPRPTARNGNAPLDAESAMNEFFKR